MPHSSGGGSHSGGSHSGISGRGYNPSSFGGRRRGHSSGSFHRISSGYFAGAQRYVYYKNKRPVYIYTNRNSTIARSVYYYKEHAMIGGFFVVAFALLMGLVFCFAIKPAKKLKPSEHNLCSLENIYDEADIFTDTSNLEKSLNDFQEKTGIIPVVLTVTNETWNTHYNNLEEYAFDYYLKLFDDEQCWLIVYSEPEHTDQEFNDWYWEGMQGDDTDDVLTDSILDEFKNTMERLLLSEESSTEDVISQAFDSIYPELRRWGSDIDFVTIFVCFSLFCAEAFVGYVAIENLFFYIKYSKAKDAVICDQSYQKTGNNEKICDYCGGIYVKGTCKNCPYCGANIPADTT